MFLSYEIIEINNMKKWLLITGFSLFILLVGMLVFSQRESPENKTREVFFNRCKEGNKDIIISIAALKTGNEELCEQIKDKLSAMFCRAEVTRNQEYCNAMNEERSIKYCKSIVTKNKEGCQEDNQCIAYVTGDISYCDKIDGINRNECKAVVLKDNSFIKDADCKDTSFVYLSKAMQDKLFCNKISNKLIKAECLEG